MSVCQEFGAATVRVLHPDGWPRPKGYSNGIVTRGKTIYTAGLVGWDENGIFPEGLVAQFRQTLVNIVAVLAEANATPEHIVRMTWYITDRDAYLGHGKEIGAIYREILGKTYPTMAVVQVVALMEAEAKIEIETTAVIPD
jgi:enamine deaminase RidA (YjgF/YER057c/UK114 family)